MKVRWGYITRSVKCGKRKCFVPYSGNGIKICRGYELGRCPKKYKQNELSKQIQTPDI